MKVITLLLLSALAVFGQINEPRIRFKTEAHYTAQALKARIQGLVVISCVVSAEGAPVNIKVERSLDPGLDESAVAAVKQWIFWPATQDGEPVAMRATVDVSFNLNLNPGYHQRRSVFVYVRP